MEALPSVQAFCVDKWRHYLQFKHFVIRTDHHNLKYLMEQKVTSALQQKRLTKLLGLDYEVQYKKRAENRVADALSRHEEQGQLLAISVSIPSWMQNVSNSYEGDPQVQDLITQLSIDLQGPSLWHYSSGILRKKGKVYIRATGELRQQLVKSFHASLVGGHSGQLGTLKRLSQLFYWSKMKQMVNDLVSSCDICQRSKYNNVAYPGLSLLCSSSLF
ncbi:hypothetical protein KY290_009957 [Solanum tuberosum]|uniref:Integrase zinc-binding domain-containing protein n=1 Tax=Solanum tuberosum TaxID=4113 RepID=A0ABQ7VX11_SOLTU|nr:hypothetical protein KY289_012651 [Solanum tuberosum]KAH0708483.1 hypothetical protein KY284_009910 [Solanum tuberosum]KAH0772820.1 hypothetical protein KY290_009957 [Solanum tuberosum]